MRPAARVASAPLRRSRRFMYMGCFLQGSRFKVQGSRFKVQGSRNETVTRYCQSTLFYLSRSFSPAFSVMCSAFRSVGLFAKSLRRPVGLFSWLLDPGSCYSPFHCFTQYSAH